MNATATGEHRAAVGRSPDTRTHTITLGIVGGGQLAKMTACAAAQLGCKVVILERQPEFPAGSVAARPLIGDWNDPNSLLELAALADVVTLENEFVHAGALAVLEEQRNHICQVVRVPAPVAPKIAERAAELARRAVEAVGAVGSFGMEMFLLEDGQLLINELAPRVHNSGHYSIEACVCSQFENHVRAVLGWPLGSTALRSPAAAMVNLLATAEGPGMTLGLEDALRVPGAHVHLYGKTRGMPGRKMGHVTARGATADEALAIAQRAAACLRSVCTP